MTIAFKKDCLVRISLFQRVNPEYCKAWLVSHRGLRSNSSNFLMYLAALKHSCAFSAVFGLSRLKEMMSYHRPGYNAGVLEE
jgi:hypothetical protein